MVNYKINTSMCSNVFVFALHSYLGIVKVDDDEYDRLLNPYDTLCVV